MTKTDPNHYTKKLVKAMRDLVKMAQTQPELAHYWEGSAGMSVLRQQAAAEAAAQAVRS